MRKKGSLNLSIEAIVIVVIAFVVLGLGLGFVREQFKDIKTTSSTIQEQIRQQILDDLRTGDKKLSFPATKLELATSEESVQAIGIKNTQDSTVQVVIGFEVKSENKFLQFKSEKELAFTTPEGNEVNAKISWDDSKQTLKPGEARVVPLTVTAPDKTGNYLYKIILNEVDDSGQVKEEFDSKTFFVKTS